MLGLLIPALASADPPWPRALCHSGGGAAPVQADKESGLQPCEAYLAGRYPDLRAEESVVFAVLGDMGTGSAEQHQVAGALAAACSEARCRFVITVGDNLYDGPERVDDPRFITWFRKPYAALDMPVWLSLGNHDWYGDPAMEIEYTDVAKRMSRGPYWFMPAPMYTVPGLPPWLDLVAVDTYSIHKGYAEGVNAQRTWLERGLPQSAAAKARWTLVFGHHPHRSSGAHGDDEAVGAFFAPWLKPGVIDAFFFGHDHHQEHFAGQTAEIFIQGAGAQVRTMRFDADGRRCASPASRDCARWKALQLGFSIVTVTRDALRVDFRAVGPGAAAPVAYSWTGRR